jgi:hypothetical protein
VAFEQTWLSAQPLPQAPQLEVSIFRSRQEPSQLVVPGWQVTVQ